MSKKLISLLLLFTLFASFGNFHLSGATYSSTLEKSMSKNDINSVNNVDQVHENNDEW